ncbi:MAG: hypothetical protein U0230_23910 [Polyangiales bacterium]
MEEVDAAAYPRVSRYLASLPDGIRSYPTCESKASMYREALQKAPKQLDPKGLPLLLQDYVRDPVPMTTWVPEVITACIYMAIADQIFKQDEAFLEWVTKVSEATFASPTYRILMTVASPEKLAGGAERRWRNFHQGSSYDIEIRENGTLTRITAPPYLFDKLYMRANARAVQAAYRASGARNAVVEIIDWSPTETRMRAEWYPERAPTQ